MELYRVNSLNFVLITLFLLIVLATSVTAETTFFDQDDAFIMSNPVEASGGITGGTTGGCRYDWNCTDWSECLASGKQTRNCTNVGACPDTYNSPETEQNCTYIAPEIEKKEPGVVPEEEKETEKINGVETTGNNKIFLYFIIGLVILSVIFCFKKLMKGNPRRVELLWCVKWA